jgi:hypothetical protein
MSSTYHPPWLAATRPRRHRRHLAALLAVWRRLFSVARYAAEAQFGPAWKLVLLHQKAKGFLLP